MARIGHPDSRTGTDSFRGNGSSWPTLFDLIVAVRTGGEPHSRWWLTAEGILSLAFAAIIFFAPNHGTGALLYLLEGYLIVSGVSLISYAWKSRRIARAMTKAKLRGELT